PENDGDIHIKSRSAIVRDVTKHARRDLRKVGVGLAGISIMRGDTRCEIDLLDPSISGLNDVQHVHGVMMRWTNGHAVIPAKLVPNGASRIELNVLRTYTYWNMDSDTVPAAK